MEQEANGSPEKQPSPEMQPSPPPKMPTPPPETSQGSGTQQRYSPNDVITIDSDSDSDSDNLYSNPEPPRELIEKHLLEADTIGDTVFSKHWLFTTLMNLIQAVDREEQAKDAPAGTNLGLDLEESIQDELCKLWDMSMNPAVVSFLMEFKAVDLLAGVIAKSKAPRAIEICVGILGNMACTDVASRAISYNEKLRSHLLLLLGSPDAPTVLETTRLLNICVSSAGVSDIWMASISNTQSVYDYLLFILQSSTNVDLLTSTAEVTDKIMDTEDNLLVKWSTMEMVEAVLEAVKQCGSRKDAVDTFLHVLQLISTCECGVEALGYHSDALCHLTLQYLIQLCSEDLVVLDGQEDAVGSALSVLATAFTSLDDKSGLLSKDFQLMRCLLKILHVVYPKLRSFTPDLQHQRSRSSDSRGSDTEVKKQKLSSGEDGLVTSSEDKDNVQSSPKEEKQSKSEDKDKKEEVCTGDAQTDNGTEKVTEKPQSSKSEDSAFQKLNPRDDRCGVLEMLYDVLQNILTDIILVLSEEDGPLSEQSISDDQSSETSAHESSQPAAASSAGEPKPKPKDAASKPQSLTYLNDLCDRQRLKVMVHMLDEVMEDTELDCCGRLRQVALNHHLSRLDGIVQQYSSS